MIPFLRKRLQVFISSTFSDLTKERQAAVEAILTAGHIPAGMELFTAGDESQMHVIEQWIDESDVYLLILGGRYGSIEPKSGKSYTHLEYEYAIKQGKPFFACVIQDDALEAKVKTEGRSVLETDNGPSLKEFRTDVLSKMVKFWSDQKDIKIAVSETLSQLSRREDLTGWVRPSAEANVPALADELTRLSRENATLRNQLKSSTNIVTIQGLEYHEMKGLLESKGLLDVFVDNQKDLKISKDPKEISKGQMDELVRLGLIEIKTSTVRGFGCYGIFFKLTTQGKAFLTRYEYETVTQVVDN